MQAQAGRSRRACAAQVEDLLPTVLDAHGLPAACALVRLRWLLGRRCRQGIGPGQEHERGDLPHLLLVSVQVDGRDRQRGVSQPSLDGPKVRPVPQQAGRRRVADAVRLDRRVSGEPGERLRVLQEGVQPVLTQPAVLTHEDILVVILRRCRWASHSFSNPATSWHR